MSMLNLQLITENPDPTLLCLLFQHAPNLLHHGKNIEGPGFQNDLARFQLPHVQHLIDQLQQKAGGIIDLLPAFCLLFQIPAEMIPDLHHAADPVDGRSDVMAHALEKFGLCHIGALRLPCRFLQTFPVSMLTLHLLFPIDMLHPPPHHLDDEHRRAVADQKQDQFSRCCLEHGPLRDKSIHIIIPTPVDHAEAALIPGKIAPHVNHLAVRRPLLDVAEIGNVIHDLPFQNRIIGGDDLVSGGDHDGSVLLDAVAGKQVLEGQAVGFNVAQPGMIIRRDDPVPVRSAACRQINIGAVGTLDPRCVSLFRILRRIQKHLLFQLLLHTTEIHGFRRILILCFHRSVRV